MSRAAAVRKIREAIGRQHSRSRFASNLPRFRVVLGLNPADNVVLVDGKRLEHLVSRVTVIGRVDDIPQVSLDFPAERVEIEGEAAVSPSPGMSAAAMSAADLDRRLRLFGKFWALHIAEFRKAFR